MEKKIIVLSLCLIGFSTVFAEDIELPKQTETIQSINLNNNVNEDFFDKSEQKLRNKGILLQNSISPVGGLQYNSGKIIQPTK